MSHPVIFQMPIPFLLGVVVPQTLPLDAFSNLPGWVATAFLGVWVTMWFLDRVGKLPGQTQGTKVDIHAHIRAERLTDLLVDLTKKVDSLGEAVTELRVELAKKPSP